jgi:hypothetical protein
LSKRVTARRALCPRCKFEPHRHSVQEPGRSRCLLIVKPFVAKVIELVRLAQNSYSSALRALRREPVWKMIDWGSERGVDEGSNCRPSPLLLGVLAVLLLVLGAPLAAVTAGDVGTLVVSASFASVGALVAHRRPENPIGWLFFAFGVCIALDFFATQYATRALVTHSGSLPAGQWLVWASDIAVRSASRH